MTAPADLPYTSVSRPTLPGHSGAPPLGWWHTDPPHLLDRAARLGELVARGLLHPDSADHVIEGMVADVPNASQRLSYQLIWAMRDAAQRWHFARNRAEALIAKRVKPLIEAKATGDNIIAAAAEAGNGTMAACERRTLCLQLAVDARNRRHGRA